MPGIFSNVFGDAGQPDGGPAQQYVNAYGDDSSASHDTASGSSSDTSVGAHVDPAIHVQQEVGAEWQDADGSHGGWSQTEDVTLTLDLNAAAEAGTDFQQSDFDA